MPSDPAQLTAQIRFALSRLSERNAQHEWEHLCRHLTRARLCSNILPATGPVQSGGDQGRDFETFHTYLARSSLSQHTFVGLISDKPIAFACSLEERAIPKMRRDVKTIMSGGVPVEKIYLFSSRTVPTAKRHTLLEWARTTYHVSLEVLDGEAIAELLSAPDTFWIAVRYLELPTELYPAPTTGETSPGDWYIRILEKWQLTTSPPQTFADFTEIQAAGRAALGAFVYNEQGLPLNQHERPELPFWIEQLDELVVDSTQEVLWRRAVYEATVLRLRGLGTLIGQESLLRRYFDHIASLVDSADIEDTEALLAYLISAHRNGLVQLTSAELQAWSERFDARLMECMQDAEQHTRIQERCVLLEVRGYFALLRTLEGGQIQVEETLSCWNQLALLAKKAPLFPLDRFANRLAEYARYLGTHPSYEPLTQAVDALVAERSGRFKTAEMCASRAKALYKAGNLPVAMIQMHRAKGLWFAEETLGKTLFAVNWLSKAYREQGLFFAAKYYALAAAYIALEAKDSRFKQLVARCLESVSSCDFATGAWNGFLEFAEMSWLAHWHLVPEADTDLDDAEGVTQPLLFHLSQLLVMTAFFWADGESFVSERCRRITEQVGLSDMLVQARGIAEQVWTKQGKADLHKSMREQLAGVPWSDAGATRHVTWKAYGVTWNVQWANDYQTTVVAEEFLAAVQVILSDFATEDLCLLRSTLNCSISLTPPGGQIAAGGYRGFDISFDDSHKKRLVRMTLPPYRHFAEGILTYDDLNIGALTLTSQLLAAVSVLPTKQFEHYLENHMARGLANKLLIGASYTRCFRAFIGQEAFEASVRTTQEVFIAKEPFVLEFPHALPWCDSPGPGYSHEQAGQHIENRYRSFLAPVERTVHRLAREPFFQATLAHLRTEGWKDWHLLSAIFHITVNYRMNQQRIILSPEAEQLSYRRLIRQPEPENALAVPFSEYTEEAMRFQMNLYLIPFAHTYGLELHHAPDFFALEDFLAQRYNFWNDDITHTDPFSQP